MRKTSRVGRKLLHHHGRLAFAADAVGVYQSVEQVANASAVFGGDRKHFVLTEVVKLACETGERQSVKQ
jgi:hypothetical protein